MKIIILAILLLCFSISSYSQQNIDQTYDSAMALYKKGEYNKASIEFDKVYSTKLSNGKLYDGVCIYALNNNTVKAIEILDYLVFQRYYSNYNHITTDKDLKSLYANSQWQTIIDGVKINLETLPERTKKKVKEELLKAKQILDNDNGKLWGEQIWSNEILVLANDNTIYSLSPFPKSKTNDSIIYYNKLPENTFSFSNSAQDYNGKKYAVIMTSYLSDSSVTIIHELFHVLQYKHRNLNGNPINYLDNYDAREWLRLEYQALRNCLNAIDKKQDRKTVISYCNDAMTYRKIRQAKYKEFLPDETSIETLEGLANYTGYKLSSFPDKYEKAVSEINEREKANTYTRPFAYATGLAYGLIFDYLKIDWKKGFDSVYNFLDIYEARFLKQKIVTSNKDILIANKRNNFEDIHKQELERKEKTETTLSIFRKKLIEAPTLSVNIKDSLFSRTFDMYGTFVLKDIGVVYTSIVGTDGSKGKNFGNFKSYPEKSKNGIAGILANFDNTKFTFPLPFKIEGNKIIGETYEIELNNNWTVKKKNDKGDFEISEK